VTDWLHKNAPGYSDLSGEELAAIAEFSLLWSLFEANVLNAEGNSAAITRVVTKWSDEGRIPAYAFRKELAYFQNRYLAKGEFTHHFESLNLRPADQLVKKVLKGEADSSLDVTLAVLIIAFRFRNNLFHGLKWAYQIRNQRDNFFHANSALMQAIALNERAAKGGT
jgi:hypothetical protein